MTTSQPNFETVANLAPDPVEQGARAYFEGVGIVANPHEGPDGDGWDAGYMRSVQDEEGFEPDRDYLETIGGE